MKLFVWPQYEGPYDNTVSVCLAEDVAKARGLLMVRHMDYWSEYFENNRSQSWIDEHGQDALDKKNDAFLRYLVRNDPQVIEEPTAIFHAYSEE